jgi:hypothetical protein
MYFPIQIPKLSMDLVKRLYPLCQRLQIPMDQFMNEAVAQAVARAEEGLEPVGAALGVAENRAGAGQTGA